MCICHILGKNKTFCQNHVYPISRFSQSACGNILIILNFVYVVIRYVQVGIVDDHVKRKKTPDQQNSLFLLFYSMQIYVRR